jgi:hypothetical protein
MGYIGDGPRERFVERAGGGDPGRLLAVPIDIRFLPSAPGPYPDGNREGATCRSEEDLDTGYEGAAGRPWSGGEPVRPDAHRWLDLRDQWSRAVGRLSTMGQPFPTRAVCGM